MVPLWLSSGAAEVLSMASLLGLHSLKNRSVQFHLRPHAQILQRTAARAQTKSITHTLWEFCQLLPVRRNLDAQLAKFLRKARGELSYFEFGKRVGISHTTLHRIERGEHHLTLHKLETVLNKLKIRLKDIFPQEF